MKFGKVLTYKDIEEAEKLIGKKVLASDFQKIVDKGEFEELITELIAVEVKGDGMRPFFTKNGHWRQFIREVIEEDEPKRMTNRQLAEWLARGNGELTYKGSEFAYSGNFFNYYKERQGEEVEKALIRLWNSNEWVIPTEDIYIRDCKQGD